jgi:hypothetical protein
MWEALNDSLWYLLLFLGSVGLNIVFVAVIWGMNRQRLVAQRHMFFALEDHSESGDEKSVVGEVSIDLHGNWLQIRAKGYGERDALDDCGDVVFIEYYSNELRLYYTDDINDLHQPHKVVLEGARVTNRIETENEET